VDLVTENYDSEEEQVNKCRQKKASSKQLKKLQTVCTHFFWGKEN
jgi:ATP-dependent RNA helicase DDX24/MAK5